MKNKPTPASLFFEAIAYVLLTCLLFTAWGLGLILLARHLS